VLAPQPPGRAAARRKAGIGSWQIIFSDAEGGTFHSQRLSRRCVTHVGCDAVNTLVFPQQTPGRLSYYI